MFAISSFLDPSKLKGLVTTPTVRIPKSFAIFAIMGETPVSVPPHSRSHENHIKTRDLLHYFLFRFLCSQFANFMIGSVPRPLSKRFQAVFYFRKRMGKTLTICVANKRLNAVESRKYHIIESICSNFRDKMILICETHKTGSNLVKIFFKKIFYQIQIY
jgi:hypothetical protein